MLFEFFHVFTTEVREMNSLNAFYARWLGYVRTVTGDDVIDALIDEADD